MTRTASLLLGCLLAAATAAAQERALPELLTGQAEAAIAKGTAYLARSQNANGCYDRNHRCTMTALAGLALMANGQTPVSGKYAANVDRCVEFLLKSAGPTGLIVSAGEEGRSMYGHGFGMLFLSQAYGMESNPVRQREIARVLRRAVVLTARSQSRDGGWLYTPNANADEGSVTVTQIQGLRACRDAGIQVPTSTIDRACKYIAKCANKDGGISYSLRSGGQSRPAITAAAVATLYSGGRYDSPVAIGALDFTRSILDKNKMDAWKAYRGFTFYSVLYAAQAMWFSSEENWRAFFPPTRDKLVGLQAADGSWRGDSFGQVFGTSIALLVLQLPYHYAPFLQR